MASIWSRIFFLDKEQLPYRSSMKTQKYFNTGPVKWFTNTITKFLQMDQILDRLNGIKINVCWEIRLIGNTALKIAEEMDSFKTQKHQFQNVGRKLSLLKNTPYYRPRHYNKYQIIKAINLLPRNRTSYRALR